MLLHLTEKMQLEVRNVLAVGDGENDICLLEAAGRSVAFQPTSPLVRAAAQYVVERNLTDVLTLIQADACDGQNCVMGPTN